MRHEPPHYRVSTYINFCVHKATTQDPYVSMICDFFPPDIGGVENHIYMLSANLLRSGHNVCSSSFYNLFPVLLNVFSGHRNHPQSSTRPSGYSLATSISEGIPYTFPNDRIISHTTQFLHVPPLPALHHPSRGCSAYSCTCESFVIGTRGYPSRPSYGRTHSIHRP